MDHPRQRGERKRAGGRSSERTSQAVAELLGLLSLCAADAVDRLVKKSATAGRPHIDRKSVV